MTDGINQFFTLKSKEEGFVAFEDNKKEKIISIGNIKITPSTFIENILLVDKLKHNLLSISQLCDVGFDVNFKTSMCIVADLLSLGGTSKACRTLCLVWSHAFMM